MCRRVKKNNDTQNSLEWDPLATPFRAGAPHNSTQQGINADNPIPSPGMSPITTYEYQGRITRSLVRSGRFTLCSQSSSEYPQSPFNRDNPRRRPLIPVRVFIENDNTVRITDDQWARIANSAAMNAQTQQTPSRSRPLTRVSTPDLSF